MDGLETVIGTHTFDAENEDELSFDVGEMITVLEKDEGYQDGWWQGRNARGEIGLFPMNYTTPSKLQTLPSLEDKIDSLETAVTQMHLPKGKDALPTPSISTTSRQSNQQLPKQQQQQQQFVSSASSTSSLRQSSVSSSVKAPASYQKKLSSKYVHHSVANSLQNPELQTCLPEDWSAEQVSIWLGLMGFSDIAVTFQDQEITGDILLELNVDSLKELDVTTFGKRFKIYNAIKVLYDENAARKEAPDINDNNSIQHHSSSPVSSSAHSILSTSGQPQHLASRIPYVDDDLVSDYSTVIRNSTAPTVTPTIAAVSSMQKSDEQLTSTSSFMASSPPTIPADPRRIFSMDSARPLMIPPPRTNDDMPTYRDSKTPLLRTLSTTHHYHTNGENDRHENQLNPGTSVHNITATSQLGATQTTNLHNNNYNGQQQQHPLGRSSTLPTSSTPTSHPAPSGNSTGISGSRTRYNFVRNSFLSSPTSKPQTALPVASRASIDGIAQRLGKENILPDMEGWLHKQGDKYRTWNKRWFVLKGSNLFYFKGPKDIRMKGIINLRGYRIVTDERIYAGKFCFRAQHDRERCFYFYTDTEASMKAWMKTLIKATITRDFTAPVLSSSTIPTVSLDAARRMKPRPPSTVFGKDTDIERPPSPSLYDSRPFSLTDMDQQGEPIMRMSMSDETHDLFPLNNQTQESGLVRKDTPGPSSAAKTQEEEKQQPLYHDSGFTSSIYKQSSRPHQQQLSQRSATALFYNEDDEDLIDPHQHHDVSSPQTQAALNSSTSLLGQYHHNLDRDANGRLNNNISLTSGPGTGPSTTKGHIPSPLFSSSPKPHPTPLNDSDQTQNEFEDQQQQQQQQQDRQSTIDGEEIGDVIEKGESRLSSWQWEPEDYVDWMNRQLDLRKISHVTDLRTGEALVELLEAISGKQVRRPATTARMGTSPLTSMQMLDNIVAAFKFMGREGVVVDGLYNIKDVFSGNETRIMDMLRTIKDWAEQLHPSTDKTVSGGTFGEEEQGKLKALDES
ncbi:hypothetical protein BCR42DRAFT_456204 [Absidia repens]|uniref:PH domain-containing protein n=1 Tax=Absidia repens TaxID=90262 RepID=A0A1X2I109_9FUNG|nr:hypothetical protein BCR42DRAFT_456204 [Absidia repens]